MPRIKSIISYTSMLFGTDKVLKEYKSAEEMYDMRGNLVFEKHISPKGITESVITFKYDTHNNLIEVMEYLDDFNQVSTKTTYTYGENNKCIAEELTYVDGSVERKHLEINNKIEKWTTLDEEEALISTEELFYSDSGIVLNQIRKNSSGETYYEKHVTLNESGKIKTLTEEQNSEVITRKGYVYDENGYIKEELFFNEDGKVIETVYKEVNERGQLKLEKSPNTHTKNYFNEDGLLERTEVLMTGLFSIQSFREFTYDENRNIIETITFDIGETYQLEPGVDARTKSTHNRVRHEYEFWDEALVYAPSH